MPDIPTGSRNPGKTIILIMLMLAIGFSIYAIMQPVKVTLDFSGKTRFVELRLSRHGPFGAPHAIELNKTTFCGDIDTRESIHGDCGRRPVLYEGFSGMIEFPSGGDVLLVSHRAKRQLMISFDNRGSGAALISRAGEATPLPDENILVIDETDASSSYDTVLAFEAERLEIGGPPRARNFRRSHLFLGGSTRIIDRSAFSEFVKAGEEMTFAKGDILNFCEFPEYEDCGKAVGILTLDDKAITIDARIPSSAFSARKVGTQGYEISVPWWKRLIAEPVVVLIWSILGAVYFIMSFREKF